MAAAGRWVCQIAVGQNWNAGVWTWTDVSRYLRSFDLNRGRQYELDSFEPGDCQLVFKNVDGRFHPFSGAASSWVRPWTPIRLGVVYGSGFWLRFAGYIERAEVTRTPDGGTTSGGGSRYSEVTVTATDALGLLAQFFYPENDDGAGFGAGRVKLGTWTERTPAYNQIGTMGAPGQEAARVYAEITPGPRTPGKEIFIRTATEFDIRYMDQDGVTGNKATLRLDHPLQPWHRHHRRHKHRRHHRHLHHHKHGGHGRHPLPGTVYEVALKQERLVRSIGSMTFVSGEYTNSIFLTVFGERPIFPAAASGAQITAMLNEWGWPVSLRSIATGTHSLIPHSPWGSSSLEAAQAIADSELGQFFATRYGALKFEGRKQRYQSWANPAVFGDALTKPGRSTAENYYAGITSARDLDHVFNDVRVTRLGLHDEQFIPQRRVSSFSVNTYGRRSLDRDTLVRKHAGGQPDYYAGQQADWIMQTQSTPRYRVESFSVMPERDPAHLYPLVGLLDISSPVSVIERPPPATAAQLIRSDFWVEGLHESASVDSGWRDYTVELELSPRITNAPY